MCDSDALSPGAGGRARVLVTLLHLLRHRPADRRGLHDRLRDPGGGRPRARPRRQRRRHHPVRAGLELPARADLREPRVGRRVRGAVQGRRVRDLHAARRGPTSPVPSRSVSRRSWTPPGAAARTAFGYRVAALADRSQDGYGVRGSTRTSLRRSRRGDDDRLIVLGRRLTRAAPSGAPWDARCAGVVREVEQPVGLVGRHRTVNEQPHRAQQVGLGVRAMPAAHLTPRRARTR